MEVRVGGVGLVGVGDEGVGVLCDCREDLWIGWMHCGDVYCCRGRGASAMVGGGWGLCSGLKDGVFVKCLGWCVRVFC